MLKLLMLFSLMAGVTPDQEFTQLRDRYVEQYRPLSIAAAKAWWEASTTGSDEAFKRRIEADEKNAELHSDRETFARLKRLKDQVQDPLLKRQARTMYYSFLPRQVDPELSKRIIALEAEVDQIFNTHRSTERQLSENDVRKILKETKSDEEARQAWTGYMEVGRKTAPKIKELVALRNQVARQMGYRDYFAMMLDSQELDEKELFATFDELDKLTRAPFAELKQALDAHMMQRFQIPKERLRPWHTDDLFFQEAPDLATVSLDDLYQGKDPVKLSQQHYESMGLEVKAILARSDLYEKPGKSPHAFAINVDRDQDIRVLCNVKPNSNWMDTMHHELGHGVYDQYIGKDVPFLLHEPAHILTTEGMAMLFGALTKTPDFLQKVVGVDRPEYLAEARRTLRSEKLTFSRWCQVMLRFEREMYRDPNQDLNRLWWSLKKEYQLLNPPDDMSGQDYGAKIHIVGAPCYYHNYQLGDLFASQVWTRAAGGKDPLSTSFYGDKQAGEFFRTQVFAPGNLYNWQELTRRATGEPLSARYFAEMYLK